jgi:ParB family chromosome partitioning protein
MPSVRKGRPAIKFEEIQQSHQLVQPVQDRIAYEIDVDRIASSPRNPRQRIDSIDELAASLQAYGLLQPVVVRSVNGNYDLVAGHRRLAAAKQLGWQRIAAVVRDESDDQAYLLTLTENLQRDDLTPKEEAAALEVLIREHGWTTRQVGEAIKRSHTYVSRRLRVFENPTLAPFVLEHKLAVTTAEELLRAPDEQTCQDLARQAAEHQWTAVDARKAIPEIGRNRSKWAALAGHLKAVLSDASQVDRAALGAADRKLIRQARAALGRLV